MRNKNLNSYKQCELCQKLIPQSYKFEICPQCKENNLFSEVKEFIRNNDVNEYQVAEYFHIPIRKVKTWIKEGRIEYKENDQKTVTFGRVPCQRCGAPVSFGTLCQKCLKLMNKDIHGYNTQKTSDASKMRFFDSDEN